MADDSGLSKFIAELYKKWPFNIRLPVQYVIQQLTANNVTDLVILRDLITALSGLEMVAPADVSDMRLHAMCGGPVLRAEEAWPSNVDNLRNRKQTQKPLARLLTVLAAAQLGRPLLVRMALQRQLCVYSIIESDAIQLKFVGHRFDQASRSAKKAECALI